MTSIGNGPLWVRATDIGEFIRHNSCARRFALGHDDGALFKTLPLADKPFHTIDVVLAEEGARREEEWAEHLRAQGFDELNLPRDEKRGAAAWTDLIAALETTPQGQQVFAREVRVTGPIGAFTVDGRIDFVLLRWHTGVPWLWLVECKASRRDRTYQRLQATLYRLLVEAMLGAEGLSVAGRVLGETQVACTVVRVDEAQGRMMALEDLGPLASTASLEEDARRLLAADGPLIKILAADLDALPFSLDTKCEDCVFALHCMTESARQRRLELLGIAPDAVRRLREIEMPDLDALADLDPESAKAQALRRDPELREDLDALILRAATRCARLPGGRPGAWPVAAIPHTGYGQLPEHRPIDPATRGPSAQRQDLVRVYLSVSYDYAEDRLCALTAHVTRSRRFLHTPYTNTDEGRRPSPTICELDPGTRETSAASPVDGIDVLELRRAPWSRDYAIDSSAEASMIQAFFSRLIETITATTQHTPAPLHFYVWSEDELSHLIEACVRGGAGLLMHLRELLGCRDPLEQLIYSVLQTELTHRFALGWTGRSLAVASTLPWFGRRYHWSREVHGQHVNLARLFKRDVFDFLERLEVDGDGVPRRTKDKGVASTFEVCARFHGGLTAPYWRAFWGALPDPDASDTPPTRRPLLRDYHQARRPGVLTAFLQARVHALRWLEERVTTKNNSIDKPPMDPAFLPDFRLATRDPARAAVDFLRLDQNIHTSEWLQALTAPPAARVAAGTSLPVCDVRPTDEKGYKLSARLDVQLHDVELQTLRTRTSIDEGGFVRLHWASVNPHEPQPVRDLLYRGHTCVVETLDWTSGRVSLSIIPQFKSRDPYVLPSRPLESTLAAATLDPSPSDYVSTKVERRLTAPIKGRHALSWFDPVAPVLPAREPLPASSRGALESLLAGLVREDAQAALLPRRVEIILGGMDSRVQLIQGPPGTGKTTITAYAVLARILARRTPGDLILIAANTHTAVNTLLERIESILAEVEAASLREGLEWSKLALFKASSKSGEALGHDIAQIDPRGGPKVVVEALKDKVVILGSTTGTMLKFVRQMNERVPYKHAPDGLQSPLLVVDEASMMVFAHFLALATLVDRRGAILMAGDNRQLAPIVAHDWEREDRPPAQLYRMHDSAFDAVVRIGQGMDEAAFRRDGLITTYRLPAPIRRLIQPLYDRDAIVLRGPRQRPDDDPNSALYGLDAIWTSGHHLYLIVHDDTISRQSNACEALLLEAILLTGQDRGCVEPDSIAIITPHRAQRALLRSALAPYQTAISVIDTVERLQGGEAETILFSGTVSDPVAIAQTTEFILGLERSNVAFSRTKERLVVLCGRSLLDHIPPLVEHYEAAMLWKYLRQICTRTIAGGEVGAHSYEMLVPGDGEILS